MIFKSIYLFIFFCISKSSGKEADAPNLLEDFTVATVQMRSFTEEVMITSDDNAYQEDTTNSFNLQRGDWIGSAMELIFTNHFM